MNALPDVDPRFPPLLRPLSKKELAEWLNCSERFLETEVAAGRLKKILLGTNRVRFLPRHVNEWLEGGGSVARRKSRTVKEGPTK